MNQVKVFIHRTLEGLQKQANEWLGQKYYEIIHAQFYKDGNFNYLMFVYKDGERT